MPNNEMRMSLEQFDNLFTSGLGAVEKGANMVSSVARTVSDTFGADSRRNAGGYFQQSDYGYGYNNSPQPPQPPVQYGYGYAANNQQFGYSQFGASFSGMNGMYENNYDGYWNPSYGQMNGGY